MELRSHINAPTVKDVYREEHIRLLEAQITGADITLAALRETAPDALADVIIATRQGMHARETARGVTPDRPFTAGKLTKTQSRRLLHPFTGSEVRTLLVRVVKGLTNPLPTFFFSPVCFDP